VFVLDYLACCIFGALLGVFTGLTPGVHVNTVCVVGLSLYRGLGLGDFHFALAMICMSVTHSFLDYIPAIFIGVPEESTALSVLPAHRLVLEGKALDAVKITGVGSVLGLGFSIVLLIPMLYIMPLVYQQLKSARGYVLALVCLVLILRERGLGGKIAGFGVFLLSSFLGFVVFGMSAFSGSQSMFPLFSGLFGMAGIWVSMSHREVRIPQQPYTRFRLDYRTFWAGLAGTFGGILVCFLPAMSPSQAGILLSGFYGSTTVGFLTAVSATNTADAIYSLISLATLGKGRSGVSEMIKTVIRVDYGTIGMLVAGIAFITMFIYRIHMFAGATAIQYYNKIGYKKLSLIALAVLVTLVYYMLGFLGLYILVLSAFVGLTPVYSNVSRTHLMGVIIGPTLSYIL
jgi:putative membrane protein